MTEDHKHCFNCGKVLSPSERVCEECKVEIAEQIAQVEDAKFRMQEAKKRLFDCVKDKDGLI